MGGRREFCETHEFGNYVGVGPILCQAELLDFFSGPGILSLGQNHQEELSSQDGVEDEIFPQSAVICSHSVREGVKRTFPL